MENEKCTYIAKIGTLWKIGATKQIEIRMQTLSWKYKHEVKATFVFNVLNHYSLESFLKMKFSDKNVNADFFDLTDDDIAFLSTFEPDESFNKLGEIIINEFMGIDLKIERIKKRLSLKQMSALINKSIGWLSMLENDRIKIKPAHVKKYMEALELFPSLED